MIRVIIDIIILFFVFVLPSYITAFLLVLSIIMFHNYFESIVLAYILDILYGGGLLFGYNFHFVFTASILIIFLISIKAKTFIKFYSRKYV